MPIITTEMVERALLLAKPIIELLLRQPDAIWGPTWVRGYIRAPGLSSDVPFIFGEIPNEWNPTWGEKRDFTTVARAKLELADRVSEDTSKIIATAPWKLKSGEFLYPGGITYLGISVGTSGAMGWTDEAISNIIMCLIIMLAHLETDRRIAAHEMKI